MYGMPWFEMRRMLCVAADTADAAVIDAVTMGQREDEIVPLHRCRIE